MLEINEDLAFQRRSWAAERVGWAVMAFLLILAALGVFAGGPLSWTTASDPGRLVDVSYGRFGRQNASDLIKVDVAAAAVASDGVTLEVDRAFTDALEITAITPEPVQAVSTGRGLRWRFAAAPGEPAAIYISVTPEKIGLSRPRLGLAGHAPAELTLFIYP